MMVCDRAGIDHEIMPNWVVSQSFRTLSQFRGKVFFYCRIPGSIKNITYLEDNMINYKEEAMALKEEIIANRRQFHGFAELGFELPKTVELVINELRSYGYEPQLCGKAGVTCVAGQGGKVVILRGDMDALPMMEESGLDFASTNGHCHSCGHDMHTAMLLGAAKLLKQHESELKGRVKFMFQPAEELLGGAADMIAAGLLENPKVDAAIGMHVAAGAEPYSRVGAVSYKKDYVTFSGDYIRIKVVGKSAHGSQPQMGVDAINFTDSRRYIQKKI